MRPSGDPDPLGLSHRPLIRYRPRWRGRFATALVALACLGTGWHFIGLESPATLARVDAALAAEAAWHRGQLPDDVDNREDAVVILEQQVLKTATDRHVRGVYPKAALYVACAENSPFPADAESTTAYSCFAVTGQDANNSRLGYPMPATINWSNGYLAWR